MLFRSNWLTNILRHELHVWSRWLYTYNWIELEYKFQQRLVYYSNPGFEFLSFTFLFRPNGQIITVQSSLNCSSSKSGAD